jgi:5'-3' exoribonuclease 1
VRLSLRETSSSPVAHGLINLDGYINESGVINTKRLQVVLDEMALWEREVFEKEYADMNWYKGKQAKHIKEMEVARKRSKLGTSLRLPM